jgi:hypothetical protein
MLHSFCSFVVTIRSKEQHEVFSTIKAVSLAVNLSSNRYNMLDNLLFMSDFCTKILKFSRQVQSYTFAFISPIRYYA